MKERNIDVRVTVVMDLKMRPATFARFRADKKDFEWYVLSQCFRNHTRMRRSAVLEGPLDKNDLRLQVGP
jgi:hypothetical protein